MARVLFVVPPLTGHVNPTVGVGQALAGAGHEVAWVGHPARVRPLLPRGARLLPLPEADRDDLVGQTQARASQVRGLASIKVFLEDFLIPLALQMYPGVLDAATRFAPEVIVSDQQAIAGGMVARSLGLPWATSATTSAELTDPYAAFPKVAQWRTEALHTVQRRLGIEAVVDEPGLSPHLVLVFSVEALIGGTHAFPEHYAFVGPVLDTDRPSVPFPWDALRPGPRVLVSLGTLNAERSRRFYQAVVDGLGGQPYQVILVAPREMVPALPDNVLRFDYVPQLQLLSRVDAVVSHGGHNTVCEALAAGVPLVVAPIKDDQPIVAQQVADAGAGLRLSFGRLRPARLATAVERVLTEPGFRRAAGRIGALLRSAGGGAAAAARIAALAPSS
ncbi:MAG TPA: glycosyltransferase [Deltaproteobacteria bacterium]|nr:glycosyltransferase [Deltaproteobacteria bacterium]